MTGLKTERRGHGSETGVERRHLHFDAAFLFLVGKSLPNAVGGRGVRVGAGDLDRRGVGPVLALGGEFGLVAVDAGLVVGAVDAGNMIERIVLRDRGPDKSAVEDIGAAD